MTDGILLRLSFPVKALSPNARVHWAELSRARKASREEAWGEAMHMGAKNVRPAEKYTLQYIFYPPGNYKYDDDGLIHRMKPARDGIADAMGVDDNLFQVLPIEIRKATGKASVLVDVRAV